jgi:hypothetical protein
MQKQFQPKADGEPSLIDDVRLTLLHAGLKAEIEAVYDTDSTLQEHKQYGLDGQRHALNKFWNRQLQSVQVHTGQNTIDERYCLIDKGDHSVWHKLFKTKIMPVVELHRLPRAF